jgi:signal transduction histidine kinase
MTSGVKLRLAAFIAAIAVLVSVIVWAAFTSARLVENSREQMALADSESFRIAREFQQGILGLNERLLRLALTHNTNDWVEFRKQWASLNDWIDQQHLSAPKEKQVLDQIDLAYDDYYKAAQQIETKVTSSTEITMPAAEFAALQEQANRLLNLAFQIKDAHRQVLVSSLAGTTRALARFQVLLLSALFLVVVFGTWLAFFVYKQLIAPLELKLVENQALLERQEKLASLGTLAAGVAHEIRTPLTAIKAWLYMHQRNLRPGTQEDADATVISREIDRLERIVKDFLVFARPSEPQLRPMPAEEPLREVHQLLAPQLQKANIHFTLEAAPAVRVNADPQQVKQVLINLVQNASEATGPNGTVALRARSDCMRLRDKDTDVVVFEISDTGKGIPAEVEKRLFDPFFSTKESGTGLGLSIAARIVEKHGGLLQYKTRVNHGTTFMIVLPAFRET